MEQASVPRFGSFKPRSSLNSTTSKDKPSPESNKCRDLDGKHRSRHQDKRRKNRSTDRTRHRNNSRDRSQVIESAIAPDEFEESDLFIIDRRGDAKNVEFGSLHRYSIPGYRRAGYGNIIGVETSTKIDRERSNDKELTITKQAAPREKRHTRLLSSKYGRASEHRLRLVMPGSQQLADHDAESDYIEVRPTRKRKRDSNSPEVSDTTPVDYRSIEGKAKVPDRPADDDLAFASDSSEGEEDLDLKARQENSVLSKRAMGNSADLDAWLALVEHQKKLVRPGVEISSLSVSERRAVADMRLSVLHEAASHITKGRFGRDRLLLALIDEGSLIWDHKKVHSSWIEALTECSSSSLLWKRYLNYIQCSNLLFCFEKCRDAYVECLAILREARDQAPPSERTSICKVQIYVLLRLTTFIREAGYDELAVAIWQATLEIQFFTPSRLQAASIEEILAAFEDFWENETPRIGEHQAEGWFRHVESGARHKRSPVTYDAPFLNPAQPIPGFLEQELKLHGFMIPSTMDDEGATVDPFRCVMFSDLKEILGALCMDLPKRGLLDAFLTFAGLPPVTNDVNNADSILGEQLQAPTVCSVGEALGRKRLRADTMQVASRVETIDTLFHDGLGTFREGSDNEIGHEICRLVDRLLERFVSAQPSDDALAEYFLAFKQEIFPEEASKSAKRLLKARSSSLRLYNAYALIEYPKSHSKAQDVWSTALSMRHRLDSNAEADVIFLWHSRLLSSIRERDLHSARKNVLAIEITSLSDARILIEGTASYEAGGRLLRVRRQLEEGFDRMLLAQRSSHASMYADCLAWLSYFSISNDNGDLYAALKTYTKHVSRMAKDGQTTALELLLQSKASMIKTHIDQKRPFKPAALKQELESDLKSFPSNSILLDLYAQLASQDRLRTLVQEQQALDYSNMDVVQWSHRICHELRRLGTSASGSTPNTVRCLFTKALLGTDSKVKHSPFLWLAWLRVEHQSKEPNASRRTKQVFLDGLRHLPWHKAWAVVGMNLLSEDGGLSEGEIKQVYETMVERGLRMRVDIEEFIHH
ncbi:Hypothetical predicted protein [Lecanosticta acicola]|uniref:Uncharacterized protein n=1 Tax=Lecanosticta acicola TaxID=111012 RepID=A0AAI9EAR3_9PEZI|nr:Hypothetical predicted protein [Lecanosticta acicola]